MATLSPTPVLKISGFKRLPGIVDAFKSHSEYASTFTSIVIDDEENDAWEEDGKLQETERMAGACEHLAAIIDMIVLRGGLESFSWTGYELSQSRVVRPKAFWKSLAKTVPTLKHLNLGFYVHEIHDLSKVDIFPSTFDNLESLELNLSGGHGDDAVQIEVMLRKIRSVKRLALYLPTCDLETCRIQGLSYNYHLPKLEDLSLSVYDSPSSGLMNFLAHHSSVKTLYLDLSSDEPLQFSETTFPGLRALHVDSLIASPFHDLLSESAARPISHLNAGSWSKESYAEIVKIAAKLTCLETQDSFDAWREDDFPQQLKEMLSQLPNLQEFALDLPTGNTSWRNEDGTWGGPRPMDVEDLTKLLSCLSFDSKIRAVRMADAKGLELPVELLADMPSIPNSLEYIRWDTDAGNLLYRLEKKEGKTAGVPCDPVRTVSKGCVRTWTDESILSHIA
ncbi:hypothetical protein MMC18_001662 [Xylographa bjoerkii]|nr:hypothetical protein [Xylographa bjoerkii]